MIGDRFNVFPLVLYFSLWCLWNLKLTTLVAAHAVLAMLQCYCYVVWR